MRNTLHRRAGVIQTIVMAVFLYAVGLILPSLTLLLFILGDLTLSAGAKLTFLLSFPRALIADIPLNENILLIVISLLGGLYFSMLVYYFKKHRAVGSYAVAGGGLTGLFASWVGLGCAACGTLLLTSLGLSGGSVLVSLLPYEGREITVLGILFLLGGIYILNKIIKKPLVCLID